MNRGRDNARPQYAPNGQNQQKPNNQNHNPINGEYKTLL